MKTTDPIYSLSVSEALKLIQSSFSPLEKETVHLEVSLDRVLHNDFYASMDLPVFVNSAMDGFGVIASDVSRASQQNPVMLNVIEDIPAGKYPLMQVQNGTASRIMTGAHLPKGADAVVPIELTNHYSKELKKFPEFVEVYQPVKAGDNIRFPGEDIRRGDIVMRDGTLIRSRELGILGMFGISDVSVYKKPKVAVGSSGDELMMPGETLDPGKIYDSNSYILKAMVDKSGGVPIDLGIIKDKEHAVIEAFDIAVEEKANLIVSSGGVSVGAYDYIRHVLEERGKLTFWRVNMRPGKPLAFGEYRGVPFIGLPGNPVSAFVGFNLFARCAIFQMSGMRDPYIRIEKVTVDQDIQSDGRQSYLRVILEKKNDKNHARLTGHQGSGNLLSLIHANALLIVPSEVKSVRSGEELDALMIDDI
jgi:molybdopterin molybdotransferase